MKKGFRYILWFLLIIFMFSSKMALAVLPENNNAQQLLKEESSPLLTNIDIIPEKDQLRIEMNFDQEIQYKDFALNYPSRFIIDVKDGQNFSWFKQFNYQDTLLKQVRIFHLRSHSENGLRIVVELKYDGPEYEIFWDEELKRLEMIIHRQFMTKESTNLATDVMYHQIRKGLDDGPVLIQALEVEIEPKIEALKILQDIGFSYPVPELQLKTSFKNGGLRGFSKISDLVKQEQGFVGINGGFFR